jgi:predicted kinase
MKTVTILKGLPASGKSTWAEKQVQSAPTNSIKRVNKDLLRKMLDVSTHSRGNEKFVVQLRDMIIMEALNDGKHVIVDDTNLHPDHIKNISRMVRDRGDECQVKIKDFTGVTLQECLKRNKKRGGDVPDSAIISMYNEFLKEEAPKFELRKHFEGRPNIILCDLDGTLALMNDRSPYDASSCFDDSVNFPVLAVLRSYPAEQIIFLSGRSDKYEEQTRKFLDVKCAFPNARLYMRKEGDFRKDSIVKKELFNNNIANDVNVDFVMDDRNQVVEMWRSLGLTCFQVADGNF